MSVLVSESVINRSHQPQVPQPPAVGASPLLRVAVTTRDPRAGCFCMKAAEPSFPICVLGPKSFEHLKRPPLENTIGLTALYSSLLPFCVCLPAMSGPGASALDKHTLKIIPQPSVSYIIAQGRGLASWSLIFPSLAIFRQHYLLVCTSLQLA